MEGTWILFTVTLKERSNSEVETPLILHPLQWVDNLFVGNLFLQSLQGQEVNMKMSQAELPVLYSDFPLAIYFTCADWCVYFRAALSVRSTLTCLRYVYKSVLYVGQSFDLLTSIKPYNLLKQSFDSFTEYSFASQTGFLDYRME